MNINHVVPKIPIYDYERLVYLISLQSDAKLHGDPIQLKSWYCHYQPDWSEQSSN